MYGLMYLNTYALDHVWFSQTRAWMALVMGSAMTAIMLMFMLKMYEDARANIAIAVAAVLATAVVISACAKPNYVIAEPGPPAPQDWSSARLTPSPARSTSATWSVRAHRPLGMAVPKLPGPSNK